MANTFELAQKYLPLLDEVYKASSRTAILDATKVDIVNGNTIKVFKTSMDGLGDYDRNKGYTDGEVAGSWETLTLRLSVRTSSSPCIFQHLFSHCRPKTHIPTAALFMDQHIHLAADFSRTWSCLFF